MEEKQSNELLLGTILGRLDGLLTSINNISTTFTAHSLSDEKNFYELRKQLDADKADTRARMDADKKEIQADRMFIAKITGGVVLVAALAPYFIPLLIRSL